MHCLSCLLLVLFNNSDNSTLHLSPIGFHNSSASPNTVYHHLPKKHEGKTLLNRTIPTRHYLLLFNNAHIKYFWLVQKKKRKNPHRWIKCLVSPSNKPISYILSKPDKQRQLFAAISLWEGQDSCSPLLYVLYWQCYPHF